MFVGVMRGGCRLARSDLRISSRRYLQAVIKPPLQSKRQKMDKAGGSDVRPAMPSALFFMHFP